MYASVCHELPFIISNVVTLMKVGNVGSGRHFSIAMVSCKTRSTIKKGISQSRSRELK